MKLQKGLVIAVCLLAAGLRLWQLETMPPGLYHDEAYNGLDALTLIQGNPFPVFHEAWELYATDAHPTPPPETNFPLFFEGNFGREAAHVYLMALSVYLLGNTVFALRLVPAIAGIVSVWLTWSVARLFADKNDKVMPLAAMFVLAILFPAIHFSRFAIRSMLFVPIELGAIWFFMRGWGKVSHLNWIISGGLIGLGLYVYPASRLFPVMFVASFLVGRLYRHKRATIPMFCGLGITAMFVASPLLIYFYRNPYFFVARSAYVATHGSGIEAEWWLTILYNIGRTIRGLFWLGETHLRHNLVGRPYLDLIQTIFFVIGMICLVDRYIKTKDNDRKLRIVVIFIAIATLLLPTILAGDAPHFGRMAGISPLLAIIVGQGVSSSITGKHIIQKVGVVVLLLVSLQWTISDYFFVYGRDPKLSTGAYGVADGFYLPDWRLGNWVADLDKETAVYLTPTQHDMATILYALGDKQDRLQSYEGASGTMPLGRLGYDTVYAVRPDATMIIDEIKAAWGDQFIEEKQEEITLLSVDKHHITNILKYGNQSFENGIIMDSYIMTEEAEKLTLEVIFLVESSPAVPLTAFIHGLAADGTIVSQDDHPPRGYPTTEWRPDELIRERFMIAHGDRLIKKIRIGWYRSATQQSTGNTVIIEG